MVDTDKYFALLRAIRDPNYAVGTMAHFVMLRDHVGFKGWKDEEEAHNERYKQSFAAEFGLAPKVYSDIVEMHGLFGFLTEAIKETLEHSSFFAQTCRYKPKRWHDWFGGGCDNYFLDEANNSVNFRRLKLPNLVDELYKIGFTNVDDIHWENVGFTYDDEFVVIDFDHCEL